MPREKLGSLTVHYQYIRSTTAHSPVTTVLLLHGLGSSSLDWSDQVPALTPFHDVLLMDLRGHGLTDKPAGPYSIRGMADDVARLVAHLELTDFSGILHPNLTESRNPFSWLPPGRTTRLWPGKSESSN